MEKPLKRHNHGPSCYPAYTMASEKVKGHSLQFAQRTVTVRLKRVETAAPYTQQRCHLERKFKVLGKAIVTDLLPCSAAERVRLCGFPSGCYIDAALLFSYPAIRKTCVSAATLRPCCYQCALLPDATREVQQWVRIE